ncbi:histidine kinase N-terminal 7TM domain-containing protein [Halolamina salifodinae]|uniref:histidine kinase n=1 Tax=Halolamina salifodinae TaxID=1202767 RepID=A0A8T4H0D7_9EURY|nr:histidine kinase N-terminal 7TM domain-containing protein [Halolamina salifodinae]MBP1987833.1 PAS domain S-box-containing protein [Halolamina salifodinae]
MSQGAQSMALLMFISTVPIIGITIYTYRNRSEPGGRGFLLCLLGMIGWSMMLLFVTWPTRVFPISSNVAGRFFFQLLVAFGWPLFIWEYLGREPPTIRHPAVVAGLGFSVVTLLLTLTNPWHHLVLRAATPTNPAGISELVTGPWYFVHIGFAIVLAMLPIGLLLVDYRDAHGIHRRQLVFLLAGWVVGFPGTLQTHLFRNVDAIPRYVDFTPVTFLITALLWGFALHRHQLFSLVPVSRRQAVETMPDPVITVDQDGSVIDANPAAQALFAPNSDLIGRSFEEFSRAYPELHEGYRGDSRESTDVTLTANGEKQHFILSVRPVSRGSSQAGSLLVFREVTALRDREQDLELLKEIFTRLFRHNFRNRLNVLNGHVTAIESQDESGVYATETDQIRAVSEQLLAHSEKATKLRKLVDSDRRQERIDLAAVAREQAECVLDDSAATVTMDVEEEVVIDGNPLVTEGIRELYENAVRHHHGETAPRLLVSVYADGGEGMFVLEDDGPGIADSELAALDLGSETSLTHGSGVGLWLVDLIVRKSHGSFTLDTETDLGGTRATLGFPRADGADSA